MRDLTFKFLRSNFLMSSNFMNIIQYFTSCRSVLSFALKWGSKYAVSVGSCVFCSFLPCVIYVMCRTRLTLYCLQEKHDVRTATFVNSTHLL